MNLNDFERYFYSRVLQNVCSIDRSFSSQLVSFSSQLAKMFKLKGRVNAVNCHESEAHFNKLFNVIIAVSKAIV